jgi:hypothetical protein
MGSMKKWMLGATLAAGTMFLVPKPAQAARIGVYVGLGTAAYVSPSPGPGYVWVDGFWANGYWNPGYWNFGGVGYGGPYYGGYGWDRGRDFYQHRGFDDRHFDRDDHHSDRGDRFRR